MRGLVNVTAWGWLPLGTVLRAKNDFAIQKKTLRKLKTRFRKDCVSCVSSGLQKAEGIARKRRV